MAPKTKGGKGKRSGKAPSAEPKLPADLSDIERPDGDDIEDDEVAAVNDTIVQFFEDRPYYYDISHKGWANKKLKGAELKVFAESIGFARKLERKRVSTHL